MQLWHEIEWQDSRINDTTMRKCSSKSNLQGNNPCYNYIYIHTYIYIYIYFIYIYSLKSGKPHQSKNVKKNRQVNSTTTNPYQIPCHDFKGFAMVQTIPNNSWQWICRRKPSPTGDSWQYYDFVQTSKHGM